MKIGWYIKQIDGSTLQFLAFNPLEFVSAHFCSAIGAMIVAGGFYTVMWGQAKQKKIETDLNGADELGSSNPTTPLLSSGGESKC